MSARTKKVYGRMPWLCGEDCPSAENNLGRRTSRRNGSPSVGGGEAGLFPFFAFWRKVANRWRGESVACAKVIAQKKIVARTFGPNRTRKSDPTRVQQKKACLTKKKTRYLRKRTSCASPFVNFVEFSWRSFYPTTIIGTHSRPLSLSSTLPRDGAIWLVPCHFRGRRLFFELEGSFSVRPLPLPCQLLPLLPCGSARSWGVVLKTVAALLQTSVAGVSVSRFILLIYS